MRIIVLGGGLFGLATALHLKKLGNEVLLLEKEKDILTKASKINQNRIHFGYHYPRSRDTASQSLNGIVSFYHYFKDAIRTNFDNYYLISKESSNLNAKQFISFCDELCISHQDSYPDRQYVNQDAIEASFLVREPIFDYLYIKRILKQLIVESKLEIVNDIDIKAIDFNGKTFNITSKDSKIYESDFVINATYSDVNDVLSLVDSSLNLKFQDVVLPIFKSSVRVGLTLMDGPFCSVLPKGSSISHSILSNVKYSILAESDTKSNLSSVKSSPQYIAEHVRNIYFESSKYFPFLRDVTHSYNWRTVKALPINNDDARVSEIYRHPYLSNFITILSGKVTTCWKIAFEVGAIINNQNSYLI